MQEAFLAVFYPAAVYRKVLVTIRLKEEKFFSSFKVLAEPGLSSNDRTFLYQEKGKQQQKKKMFQNRLENTEEQGDDKTESDAEEKVLDAEFLSILEQMKKGESLEFSQSHGERGEDLSPPKTIQFGLYHIGHGECRSVD